LLGMTTSIIYVLNGKKNEVINKSVDDASAIKVRNARIISKRINL